MNFKAINVVKGKFMWAKIVKREQLTEDLWKTWLQPEEKFNFNPILYNWLGRYRKSLFYSFISGRRFNRTFYRTCS